MKYGHSAKVLVFLFFKFFRYYLYNLNLRSDELYHYKCLTMTTTSFSFLSISYVFICTLKPYAWSFGLNFIQLLDCKILSWSFTSLLALPISILTQTKSCTWKLQICQVQLRLAKWWNVVYFFFTYLVTDKYIFLRK